MNMSAGDLLIGRNATTTGSHYIGGGLTVMGNYLLTGGTNMNAATITDTLALGGYQQFTETGDNYVYFDNAFDNYLKWNDSSDQFEFSNGLTFSNATATDSFYASNIFITNGGSFNSVTTTDTAYFGGKLQVAGAPTSTIASSLAIDTNTLVVNANEGRVGVATLNPQQALDVTGNAQVSGRLAVGTTDNSLYALNVLGNSYFSGSATTTGSYYIAGTASTTQLFVQGAGHIGGNASLDGTLTLLGASDFNSTLDVAGAVDLAASAVLTNVRGTLSVDEAAIFDSTLAVVSTADLQGAISDSNSDLNINDNLIVSGNATTSGYLVIGATQPTMNMSAGDLLIGRNATTTGSHYIGGDLTVAGNYTLTGGMNMNSATITDTLALGGYQQFTETGDNYIYFDNAFDNYLKWNDAGDQFELSNGLTFSNATATDSFYASNIFITNGGSFNSVTTTDTAYFGGQAQIIGNLTVSGAGTHAFSGTIDPTNVAAFTLTGEITGNDQTIADLNTLGVNILQDDEDAELTVNDNLNISGNATTTGSHYIAGTASTTQLFVQGAGHIGGNASLDGTLTLLGAADLNSTLDVAGAVDLAASGLLTNVRGTLSVDEAAIFDSTLAVVSTADLQGAISDSNSDLNINDNLIVSGNATTSGYLVIGATQPTMNMSAGDILIGRNATTTGSYYIGGDLTVAGNYTLTGGMNMNSATITDTLALGGYQQFTETGDNYIYFDNAFDNYLKWNDAGDQFELSNGLTFSNATATDSFYASNIFITNGGSFNSVTTTDTAYFGGKLQN